MLALHGAGGGERWLTDANDLAQQAIALFWDAERGLFYDTGGDQETLIVRPRDVTDNALPSGHSMMADVLTRLAVIAGNDEYRAIAAQSLRGVRGIMEQFPTGAGHWLCALDGYLSESVEAVIVADSSRAATPMLRRLASVYRPGAIAVFMQDGDAD